MSITVVELKKFVIPYGISPGRLRKAELLQHCPLSVLRKIARSKDVLNANQLSKKELVTLFAGRQPRVPLQSTKKKSKKASPKAEPRHTMKTLMQALEIKNPEVRAAMEGIDRAFFCPSSDPAVRYGLRPCRLTAPGIVDGEGAMLSSAVIHAQALDAAVDHWKNTGYRPSSSTKILDVGSGSGYMSLAFLKLTENKGKVYGIEYIPDLVRWSRQQLRLAGAPPGKIEIKHGDGWKGWPEKAPFDIIYVGAAAAEIPTALEKQLAYGGRMIIPVGTESQYIIIVDKALDGSITRRRGEAVRFVPLVKQ